MSRPYRTLLTTAVLLALITSCTSAAPVNAPEEPPTQLKNAIQRITVDDAEWYYSTEDLTFIPAPEPEVELVEENPDIQPEGKELSPNSDGSSSRVPGVPADGPAAPTGPSQPSELPSTYSGPTVGGFFLYTSSNPDVMSQTVRDIKATGADTLVTFGSRVKPVAVAENRPAASEFNGCVVNGSGCLLDLLRSRTVNRVFTYEDKGQFSSAAFQCDGDRNITAEDGSRYTILVIPTRGGDCYANPDVVVTKDMNDKRNANRVMIDTAAQEGMRAFVGMPAPVMRGDMSWLPDMSYASTLNQFTQRFLVNYRETYAGNPGLAGFYHHVEMPLRSSDSWNDVRTLYAAQNILIAQNAPGYSAMVSPYMDARKNSSASTPLSDIRTATSMLANTANGVHLIIAPQDGQGTGKVGAFDSSTAWNWVDEPSTAVAGSGKYGDVYMGGTREYMENVVAGSSGAEIWVNLELMTATTQGAPVCPGASNGRGQASVERVREQARLGTPPGVAKTIGFMWQPYATCGDAPLSQTLR